MWQAPFNENFDSIRAELEKCMNELAVVDAQRSKMFDKIQDQSSLLLHWIRGPETVGNDGWLNFGLILNRNELAENLLFCPQTAAAIRAAQTTLMNENEPRIIRICGFSWLKVSELKFFLQFTFLSFFSQKLVYQDIEIIM